LFEMFVQDARGSDRARGGLGLGLSLVRTLTALHGGTVHGHSEGLGRGSEFTVRLPAAAPLGIMAPAGNAASTQVAGTVGKRVLVVDDNRDAADLIGFLITRAGHEVRV